jgi:hypothetical protein
MGPSVPPIASVPYHAPISRFVAILTVSALAVVGCGSGATGDGLSSARLEAAATPPSTTTARLTASTDQAITASTTGTATPTTGSATTGPASTTGGEAGAAARAARARPAPAWLGQRPLPTTPDGEVVAGQVTPDELLDRRFETVDLLAPPPDGAFAATIGPLEGEVLARSTWVEGCPVGVDDLAYVTVSFRGFDGGAHTGELIVHRSVATDLVGVFERLWDAGFPIEEMRVTSRADLDAAATGDGNNTAAFVCRPVTGGSTFSEHASGLAIDINPFLNPYQRGDLVLPELAAAYLQRSPARDGMITDGDVVVEAFAAIGWGWGGDWTSLKDYQHFSHNGR